MIFCAKEKAFAVFLSFITVAVGLLVHVPTSRLAVEGETIQFNCSTDQKYSINWHRIPFGSSVVDYIYLSKTLVNPRFIVTVIKAGNNVTAYNVVISSVTKEDAGIYRCIDEVGQGQEADAQLTVIDSHPNCSSNIGPDGFIGENDCGLQPEMIQCHCTLGYAGNAAPEVQWTISSGSDLLKSSVQTITSDNTVSSSASLSATLDVNGISFVWSPKQYSRINWTSGQIKLLYVKENLSSVVINSNKTFTCSVQSSEVCRYRWHASIAASDSSYESETVEGSTIIVHRPGQYHCQAICRLRHNTCTVMPSYVDFISSESEFQFSENKWTGIIIGCAVFAFVCFISLFIICFYFQRKIKRKSKVKVSLITNGHPMKNMKNKATV